MGRDCHTIGCVHLNALGFFELELELQKKVCYADWHFLTPLEKYGNTHKAF